MQGRWNRAGFAARRFREALPGLLDTGRSPRQRLAQTLTMLQPVVTNTTGLAVSERRLFYRLLADAGAYVDLEAPDLTGDLTNAPDAWVEHILSELRLLVARVVEEKDSANEYVADESAARPGEPRRRSSRR